MAIIESNRLGVRMDIVARRDANFDRTYHSQIISGDTYVDFDFSTYTGAKLQVRRKSGAPVVELEFSTDNNTIELGTDGRFRLIMSDTLMGKIRAGEYEYDMYLTSATWAKRDFLFGLFKIEDKITN